MSVEARNLRNRQVFGPEQQVFDDYMRTVLDITEEEIRGAVRTQGLATFSDFIGMESQDINQLLRRFVNQEVRLLVQQKTIRMLLSRIQELE